MKQADSPRPAAVEDLDQVVAIEAYSNRPPWKKESFATELEKSTANFWVITDDETDEQIYAYVVFSFLGEQAHIQTLAVSNKRRRRGYGSRLVRYVINYVLRQGGDSVYLEVRKGNAAALALYQQLGFIVVRTVKGLYSDGEDAYAMLFRLNPDRERDRDAEDAALEMEDDAGSKKNYN